MPMTKGARASTYRQWLTHFIAECKDCSWESTDYLEGPRKAAEHARKTGHRIDAEKGYAVRYGENIADAEED